MHDVLRAVCLPFVWHACLQCAPRTTQSLRHIQTTSVQSFLARAITVRRSFSSHLLNFKLLHITHWFVRYVCLYNNSSHTHTLATHVFCIAWCAAPPTAHTHRVAHVRAKARSWRAVAHVDTERLFRVYRCMHQVISLRDWRYWHHT